MNIKLDRAEAKAYVDEIYRKVAKRWQERVTDAEFMKRLASGTLGKKALRIFFKNWAAYTIEINTSRRRRITSTSIFSESIGI